MHAMTPPLAGFEKPLPHLSLSDWHNRVKQLVSVADSRRDDSFKIRQDSRNLRNETKIESDWSNYSTNESLEERISELTRWRTAITQTYERIIKEMELLADEKISTERELESFQLPIAVVAEILSVRDSKSGAELTYDEADMEIKNELAVLENNQRLLADQCQKAWEKLARLEEVKFKVGLEIGNKNEAEYLDKSQLQMNRFSPGITYKTDPLRIPTNSCTYEQWLEHNKNMKRLAENELADTYAIRESLFVCREKARTMLKTQQDRTDHAIRKRVFETERARNEMQWQKLKMREEMEKTSCEMQRLENALLDKSDALKLAETRVENRAQRSGMELALDEAHDALLLEVKKLRNIRLILSDKIAETQTNYNLLANQANRIDVDLANKEHSLEIDLRCLDLRKRLKGGPFGPTPKGPYASGQTQRNIELTKMESQIPKEFCE